MFDITSLRGKKSDRHKKETEAAAFLANSRNSDSMNMQIENMQTKTVFLPQETTAAPGNLVLLMGNQY